MDFHIYECSVRYVVTFSHTSNLPLSPGFFTDSTEHFFRGALYFNCQPNQDSIAPMLDYMREDIVRLMESFEWR